MSVESSRDCDIRAGTNQPNGSVPLVLLSLILGLCLAACAAEGGPAPGETASQGTEQPVGGTAEAERVETRRAATLISPSVTPSETAAPSPTPFSCDLPPMVLLQGMDIGQAPAQEGEEIGGQIYATIGFLELPFPYDGGNEQFGGTDEQFREASQRSFAGGRINSYFDHLLPLYPAGSRGREPAEPPIGENILIYDGTFWPSSQTWYSGHPAYDFSTFVPREPSTPVFAAANGEVFYAGKHEASGALYVKIKHTIEGVGDFVTIYWHLHPDKYFEAMRGQIGEPIVAGTRVGTMGNTGWSTGHHLHFEVRFDANKDGLFPLDEAVDPYGFTPSPDYPADPWGQNWSITDAQGSEYGHAASPSPYLWIHPLGVSGQVAENGGGRLDLSGYLNEARQAATLCAPPGALPPGGTLHWKPTSDPPKSPGKVGVGDGFTISGFDIFGKPVFRFDPPLIVQIPFSFDRLADLEPTSLEFYWFGFGGEGWVPLSAEINLDQGVAIARIDRPGTGALLATPVRDVVPPRTIISVSGPSSPEGVWYDDVTVELFSTDLSGIDRMEYSLDSGTTWQTYSEPFALEAGDKPAPPPSEAEEDFGSGPGRYLVLASSTDGAGNIEDPPAYRPIAIDPCAGPPPSVVADKNAYCRLGPAIGFEPITYMEAGDVATMLGRDLFDWWWYVELAEGAGKCWVPWDLTTVEGVSACVDPISMAPPTPGDFRIGNRSCSRQEHSIVLKWEDNSDMESGFRVYRDGSLLKTLAPNATSFTDKPPFGGPFAYQIEAINDAGSSPTSSIKEGEACVVVPPESVRRLRISSVCTRSEHTNTLTWIDDSSIEEGFRIYRNGDRIATLSANTTSFTDNGAPRVALTYEVEAFNDAGRSPRRSVSEDPTCYPFID
jgi:murein DD-endopeptidase MepM/ murein hydrolase activator NlpD